MSDLGSGSGVAESRFQGLFTPLLAGGLVGGREMKATKVEEEKVGYGDQT